MGGGEWAGFVPKEQSRKERRIFGAMWGDSGSPTTAVVYVVCGGGSWRKTQTLTGERALMGDIEGF